MGMFSKVIVVLLAIIAAYLCKFYSERNQSTVEFLSRVTQGSISPSVRMFQAVGLQLVGTNPVSTFAKGSLVGQLIVITGGNAGIGKETAKGLAKRGADVIIVGRSEPKIQTAVDQIKKELADEGSVSVSLQYIVADMSDLKSVTSLAQALHHHFGDRKIDQLVLNAAIWPSEYTVSKQGHEIAFATNTLGPHLLLRALIHRDVLKHDARVISVTGDIYITVIGTADETCTSDYSYGTPAGSAGQVAYCRSKLGMMWLFDQMHASVPSLRMYLVHPGVIDTGLSGDNPLPKSMLLSNEEGAQTTLICATADASLLENGAYYHNTLGKLVLPDTDPAKNATKRANFYALVESMIAPYLEEISKGNN